MSNEIDSINTEIDIAPILRTFMDIFEYSPKIIKIVEIFFPHAKIYLFGSRARGDYTETSDIDIAIDNGTPISMTEKGQILSMIDALNIPQKVDVVDLNRIPATFKDIILKEGILWKG